jgi:hypothetical protein
MFIAEKPVTFNVQRSALELAPFSAVSSNCLSNVPFGLLKNGFP